MIRIQAREVVRFLVVPASLVALAVLTVPPASADPPGDHCGVVKAAGGTSPTATDALAILKAAVARIDCVLCDVDNSGSVVSTDALTTLKHAVGGTPALQCPSYSKTPCTQAGLEDAIDDLNATSLDPILPDSHIVFDCEGTLSSPIVVAIDETWASPSLTRDDVMIAGTGRFIEFELDPLCYNRCLGRCSEATIDDIDDDERTCTQNSECSGTCKGEGACSGGDRDGEPCVANGHCPGGGSCTGNLSDVGPTPTECTADSTCSGLGVARCSHDPLGACPDVNSGGERFLELSGDKQKLKDLTVRGFFEGVHLNGEDIELSGIVFDRQCDDSVSNQGGGVGGLVRDSVIQKGCDKCVQDNAGPAISGCQGTKCFHVTYSGVDFLGCDIVARTTTPSTKLHFVDVTVDDIDDTVSFRCDEGIDLSGVGTHVEFDNLDMDNCYRGLQLGGSGTTYEIRDSVIDYTDTDSDGPEDDNNRVGITAFGSATVDVERTVITNHGKCCGTGTSLRGGVAVSSSAEVNLLGDDPDGNKICNNKLKNGTHREVDNRRTGYEVPAQENWWCNGSGGGAIGHFGDLDDANALSADPF